MALYLLCSIGVAAAAIAIVDGLYRSAYKEKNNRSVLATALGQCRFTESRLTGMSEYSATRGCSSSRRSVDLRVVEKKIMQEAESTQYSEAIADRAVLELLSGKPRAAVTSLESAVGQSPSNASLLNDLAVAYMELAVVSNEPIHLVRSMALIDRAFMINPNLPEARFNRAVVLEKLHLLSAAQAAWGLYLDIDKSTGWAIEAAHRRNEIRRKYKYHVIEWHQRRAELQQAAIRRNLIVLRQLIRDFAQPVRTDEESSFFSVMLGISDKSRSEIRDQLAKIQVVADVLHDQGGDAGLSSAIAGAYVIVRQSRRERLASSGAYKNFVEGLRSFDSRRFQESRPLFVKAYSELSRIESPYASWAAFYIAVCDYQAAGYFQSRNRLVNLKRRINQRHLVILMGRIHWMIGLIDSIAGKLENSVKSYSLAAELFEKTKEQDNIAAIYNLKAQALAFLGAEGDSWRYRMKSLSRIDKVIDPLRRQGLFEGAAAASLDAENPIAALAFQEEAVTEATATSAVKPDLLAEALLRRSEILQKVGHFGAARKDLEKARLITAQVQDSTIRRIVEIEIRSIDAKTLMVSNPPAAIQSLGGILDDYSDTRFWRQLANIYTLRAQAHMAMHNDVMAEVDLKSALCLLEREGREIQNSNLRTLFLDAKRQVFGSLVDIYARKNQTDAALDYAERSRSQCLLSRYSQGAPFALTPERHSSNNVHFSFSSVRAALPSGVAIIEFEVHQNQILSWTITPDGIVLRKTPFEEARLEKLVEAMTSGLRERLPVEGSKRAAELLFDILIRPSVDQLARFPILEVVPDRCLFNVPFAALRDRRANKFLVELKVLGEVPSTAVYAEAIAIYRQRISAFSPKVVVVGDPAVNSGERQDLLDLKASREEAISVASIYPGSVLLLREKATESMTYLAAADADILHIAAHGNPGDDGVNSKSGINFALDQGAVRSIKPMFTKLRLVYLSACETAQGRFSISEGPLSSAYFYMSGGAPLVIASIWKVEDRKAKDFSIAFHRRLKSGLGPLDALQQTQVKFIKNGESVRAWAPFLAIGAAI